MPCESFGVGFVVTVSYVYTYTQICIYTHTHVYICILDGHKSLPFKIIILQKVFTLKEMSLSLFPVFYLGLLFMPYTFKMIFG